MLPLSVGPAGGVRYYHGESPACPPSTFASFATSIDRISSQDSGRWADLSSEWLAEAIRFKLLYRSEILLRPLFGREVIRLAHGQTYPAAEWVR